MTFRPSLARSIPFWVLLVVSAALTGVGAWLVLDRLGRMEAAILTQSPEATIEVYVGAPSVTASAFVLGAGLVGLLLTLAVAAVRTLLPAAPVVFAEELEETEEEVFPTEDGPVIPAAPAVATEPVIAEDPDVETPSDAAPPAAARD